MTRHRIALCVLLAAAPLAAAAQTLMAWDFDRFSHPRECDVQAVANFAILSKFQSQEHRRIDAMRLTVPQKKEMAREVLRMLHARTEEETDMQFKCRDHVARRQEERESRRR